MDVVATSSTYGNRIVQKLVERVLSDSGAVDLMYSVLSLILK